MIKYHRFEIEKLKTWQDRFAESVTAFAGTMAFVYIHVGIFALWIVSAGFGHDPFPFQFLTMAVSLEAIILSTLVMIGQNRQAAHADVRAELDYEVNVKAEEENKELITKLDEVLMVLKPYKLATPEETARKLEDTIAKLKEEGANGNSPN